MQRVRSTMLIGHEPEVVTERPRRTRLFESCELASMCVARHWRPFVTVARSEGGFPVSLKVSS
jgi:hypothetical protein